MREKAAESGISPSKLLEELIESLLPDDEDDSSRDTVPPDEDDDDDTIPLDLPEDLPDFAKRYRANFRYQQDDYYSPKVNSYFFDNGKLVNVDDLVPYRKTVENPKIGDLVKPI